MMIGDPLEEEPVTAALRLPEKQEWTVDDLVGLPEDLRYELIDGRLILPSPTGVHQILGVELVLALRTGCPAGYAPVPGLSLKVSHRNEPRPDVVVIGLAHIGRSPAPVEGALLAVEIISPDSHFRDMYAKAKVYAAAGVENYWVLDPLFDDGIVLSQFRPGPGGDYEMVGSTKDVFKTDVPFPVTIDLPALTVLRRTMLDYAPEEA